MSGALPQNRGNRSRARHGIAVSRRLRSAGWNISPAGNRHKRDGIFVRSAGDDFVSVLVDLGAESADVADRIGRQVTAWGFAPRLSHHEGYSSVQFNYR